MKNHGTFVIADSSGDGVISALKPVQRKIVLRCNQGRIVSQPLSSVIPGGVAGFHLLEPIIRHIGGQALTPVTLGGIHINPVPPPAVSDFMTQTGMNDKRQLQHPAPQQRIGRKTKSSGEEIFYDGKFLKRIGAEKIRIKREIISSRPQIRCSQVFVLRQ